MTAAGSCAVLFVAVTVNFARPNNPADVTVNKVASAAIEQAQWSMVRTGVYFSGI